MPVDRRTLLMTTLMTGFTLAVARAQEAPVHTDDTGLDAGEAQVTTPNGPIPAYYARPQGAGPFPIILVIEEIFGVHEYIKDICRRFAKLGYLAVAPELYARIADLSKMTDPHEIVAKVISKAPDGVMLSDLDSTAGWAAPTRATPSAWASPASAAAGGTPGCMPSTTRTCARPSPGMAR